MNADDPHYDQLAKTLNKNTSLDKVFPVLHVQHFPRHMKAAKLLVQAIVVADYEDQIRVEFLARAFNENAQSSISPST